MKCFSVIKVKLTLPLNKIDTFNITLGGVKIYYAMECKLYSKYFIDFFFVDKR